MRVELLQHPGCRFAPMTHQLVQQCLAAVAVRTPVLVRVGDYPSHRAGQRNRHHGQSTSSDEHESLPARRAHP
jgi:hypothetical protein